MLRLPSRPSLPNTNHKAFGTGMDRRKLGLILFVTVMGSVSALGATMAVISLTDNSPLPLPPLGYALSMPLSGQVHAIALEAAEDPAAKGTTQRLQQAMDLNQRVLRQSPMQTQAWLMQAWLASMRDGYFSAEAQSALAESYKRVRIDPDVGAERCVFVLNAWERADPDLQNAVLYELEGLYRAGLKSRLRSQLTQISNPYGLTALTTLLAVLDADTASNAAGPPPTP